MHTIIVDDETFAINALLRLLRRVDPNGIHTGVRRADEFMRYIESNPVDVAFVDVDLYGTNGIILVRKLAKKAPGLNVIIYTGHPKYKDEAMDLYVSGYLVKPVDEDDLRDALNHLRHPVKTLRVRCFGYFDVFCGTDLVKFSRKDSKQVLAYLIDKRGSEVSDEELRYILWSEEEDTEKKKGYIRTLIADIRQTLAQYGVTDVIDNSRGYYSVKLDSIACDYYDYLNGKQVSTAQLGQYMEQFSTWSYFTKKQLFGADS